MEHHRVVIQGILFACYDMTAQLILVRTTVDCPLFNLFIETFKDIPLLDCVGSQYPCCDRSFSLSICILRFVNESLITDLFILNS